MNTTNTTPRNDLPAHDVPVNGLPVNARSRLSALALASVMTMAMLLGVHSLATSEAGPAQLAHHPVQKKQA